MLPSHFRSGGSTDAEPGISSRLSGPLLEARKKYGNKQGSNPTGLIFLTAACCLVLVFRLWAGPASDRRTGSGSTALDGVTPSQRRVLAAARRGAKGGAAQRPRDVARIFPAPHLRNLVLVACHSVYTGLDFKHSEEKSSWYLLDYQKDVHGQTQSFVEHIQLGVKEAAADPESLLLFSGGKTRRDAGPRAEGEGYWLVAEAAQWYGTAGVRERAFTEVRSVHRGGGEECRGLQS